MSTHDPVFARLVERQLRNWELAREQRRRAPATHDDFPDFICVSRMVGINGRPVAFGLAERLGWPAFHREILEVMAGDDRLRRRIYATLDQRDLSWGEDILHRLLDEGFHLNDLVMDARAQVAPAPFAAAEGPN